MSPRWPGSLVLAGAGKMGGALLRGWLAHGLAGDAVHVIDPHLDDTARAEFAGLGVSLDAPSQAPEVLILAVKPQTFSAAPGAFALFARAETLVISILAGKTLAALRAGLPHAGAIVRAMPNLPASIGQGATGAAAEETLTPLQRGVVTTLLEAVGRLEWLDESLIDAVTAVSGSGPAYVFHLTECLAEAGTAAGLPPEIATRLARATVEGAAGLMRSEPGRSAADLRQAVTSPGGTTAAALAVLDEKEGLANLLAKAVAAAKARAGELAT